jgi:hypothetical protein
MPARTCSMRLAAGKTALFRGVHMVQAQQASSKHACLYSLGVEHRHGLLVVTWQTAVTSFSAGCNWIWAAVVVPCPATLLARWASCQMCGG